MAVLLHSSFRRLLIRSEMRTCYRVRNDTKREGKGRRRVEASSLVSRRLECLVWERTEIWQGLIKDIGFLPNSSTAVLRETLVACLIKRRLIFKLHPPTLETRQTKFHTFFPLWKKPWARCVLGKRIYPSVGLRRIFVYKLYFVCLSLWLFLHGKYFW